MKVCLVSQSCDNRTGIGRIVNFLATEFLGFGHEVTCAAQHFEGGDRRIAKRLVPRLSSSQGVNKLIMRWSGPRPGDLDVDILHTFGVGRGAQLVSAQSCHRAGMDILRRQGRGFLEGHGLGIHDRISLADERALISSPSTRRIVAVSHLVRSQIEEYYRVDPGKIAVVPNGVDYALFERLGNEIERDVLRADLGIHPDKFVLLFVANEFGRKGLNALLHGLALTQRKEVYLLVVGAGSREPYERLAGTLGIADKVSFTGSIAGPERLYFAADAFVLPTLYEPFGLVVLEAMAAGIPVITSRQCGATEGMTHLDEVLLLEEPSSAEEIASSINSLIMNEQLRKRMAEAGREAARQFSWNRVATQMLEVYTEVAFPAQSP